MKMTNTVSPKLMMEKITAEAFCSRAKLEKNIEAMKGIQKCS